MKTDLTGQRFGKLLVLAPTAERMRGAVVWRCRCDCGKEILLESRRLKSGAAYSCGCEKAPYENEKDLTGMKFGRLTVLRKSENRAKDRNPLWICRCDCGAVIETTRRKLVTGSQSSCGCGRKPPLKDYIGKRFGMLTVTEYVKKENGSHLWKCRCDCGGEIVARQNNLQDGQTTSCGCRQSQRTGLHFVDGTFIEGIQSETISRANTSGVRGVYFNRKRGKWVAQIMFKGRCYYLGGYSKLEDAKKARQRAEEEIFGSFLSACGQEDPEQALRYHQQDVTKRKAD